MINHGIEEVRQRLEDELGFGLPEETWKYVADLHVEEVLLGGWTIRDLAGTVRDLLKAFGRPMLPRHHAPRVLTRPRKRSEGMTRPRREEVISGLLADEAENEEGVATFRNDVLGGSLLSARQVDGWIKRQAEEDGPSSLWLTVPVPKGTKVKSSTRAATTEPPLTISEETPAILIQRQYLSYISLLVGMDEDPTREMPTAEGEVLERLRQLSETLARHYGWDKALATNFVLTGEAPLVPSVEIGWSYPSNFRTLARISITVDPALSPREVADHYRRVRAEIVGGRHRELSEKHMRLATFTTARAGESWRKQMVAWNRKYPDWRYKTETNFGRDCKQAIQRLLHPDYGPKIEV